MTQMIDIKDSKDGLLTVTLPRLLETIGAAGSELTWSIFYLWATGDLGDDKSMVEFEDKISESPNGLFFSWQELNELASKFDQMIDTVIVASPDKDAIQKCKEEEGLYLKHDIVLDLFDGAYWRVYAKDKRIIENLEKVFLDTEPVRLPTENE